MLTTNQNHIFSNNSELQKLLVKVHNNSNLGDTSISHVKSLKSILRKAKELKLEKEQVYAVALLAKQSLAVGQFSKVLEYIFQGLPLAQKHKMHDRTSNFYNWLASVYLFVGDYSNALDYYQLEIKHNISSGLEEHCFIAYSMIGCIYIEIGDNNTAELFYEKALDIINRYPNHLDVYSYTTQVHTGIVQLKIVKEQYKEAEKLCFKMIEAATSLSKPDDRVLPSIYSSLALIAHKTGRYKEGIKYAHEAEKYKEFVDADGKAYIYMTLALNYLQTNQKRETMLAFDECIKCFPHLPAPSYREIEVLNTAKEFFEGISDSIEARRLQNLIHKTEINFQVLQEKLAIRAEQLLAITTKYAPAGLKPKKEKISIRVIGLGIKIISVNDILTCYTDSVNGSKNIACVKLQDVQNPYRVSLSLRKLYNKIDHKDFVWINRNLFVNKAHVPDWDLAIQSGKVTIGNSNFNISRRCLQTLKNEMSL